MDTDNSLPLPPFQAPPSKFKKVYILYALALLIIIGELVWAYTSLYKKSIIPEQLYKNVNTTAEVDLESQESSLSGSIKVKSPRASLKVGEKMTVTVYVDSGGKSTDGTDLIINYDPKLLSIDTIGPDKKAMAISDIYNEYPSNSIDDKKGIIAVSGIANDSNGMVVNGILGSIIFTAKSAGKSTISVEFTPNIVSESNIIETKTGKDLLGQVQNLEVEIK